MTVAEPNSSPFRLTGARYRILLVSLALTIPAVVSCGAKTGLLVPDASHEPDADVEVDVDVEVDADSDTCRPRRVDIDRRVAEVMFTVDRSASMSWNLEGDVAAPSETSRWEMLEDALYDTLYDVEHLIEVGAKFFPLRIDPGDPIGPEAACEIEPGIELEPAPYNTDELIDIFQRTLPEGGTPTAPALAEASDFMVENERPGVSQFIVLATDGGPNCNHGLSLPCVCTGDPVFCDESLGGVYNCLDDDRTLDVITRTFEDHGIPVFVIGIDDPTRWDLADFLDEMAIAGGRPRSEPSERRFYSVRREGELRDALDSITSNIARCLFVVDPDFAVNPRLEILLNGDVLVHDTSRFDGWDWTDPEAGELTLFGASCNEAVLPSASVTARLICEEYDAS